MKPTDNDPIDWTQQAQNNAPEQPEPSPVITVLDLERKLAASHLSSHTTQSDHSHTNSDAETTVDPTPFLSINLLAAAPQPEKKSTIDSSVSSEPSSTHLPTVEYDSEDLSATEFFNPGVIRSQDIPNFRDGNVDTDLDLEPIAVFSRFSSTKSVASLLNPEEYQHIFDDRYLDDLDQAIESDQGRGESDWLEELDIVRAFDLMGFEDTEKGNVVGHDDVVTSPPSGLSQSFPQDRTIGTMPAYQGLGQSIYCLPCNPGREEDPFSMDVPWDVDVDSGVLEALRPEAELDFDQESSLSKRDLQNLIRHVVKGEAEGVNHNIPSAEGMLENTQGDNMEEHNDTSDNQEICYQVSNRAEALSMAEPLVDAFYNKGDRQCFGHKDKIFGIAISPCGNFCATASQDSTVCVWNVAKNSLLSTIVGNKDYESLRVAWASDKWGRGSNGSNITDSNGKRFMRVDGDVILGTAGADGMVKIWQSVDGAKTWIEIGCLDHLLDKKIEQQKNKQAESAQEEHEETSADTNGMKTEEELLGTEVYALQFIDDWQGLPSFVPRDGNSSLGVIMTSSEDFIHIWQWIPPSHLSSLEQNISRSESELNFKADIIKIMDIKFTHLEHGYGGVFVHLNIGNKLMDIPEWSKTAASNIVTNKRVFGGDRNPEKLVFVFDAVQCPSNSLLGVALSDGTLRLVNSRGVCVTILQLPGCESHLTSFNWNKTGHRLASCVATGHVVLWDIDYGEGKGIVKPVCRAVLEGGHTLGRPLFGASFLGGDNEDLLLSWGVDGKLCLWDSLSKGQIGAPICVLVSNDSYPIYAVDVYEQIKPDDELQHGRAKKSVIGVAGGNEGGFIGVPVSLYNF